MGKIKTLNHLINGFGIELYKKTMYNNSRHKKFTFLT